MSNIEAFCQLTGRTLCDRPEYATLIDLAYDNYLSLTGTRDLAPATVVTDDGVCAAFYTGGKWSGVVIDRRYVETVARLIDVLLDGENCAEVARPLIDIIASELAQSGKPTEALMLKHEPVSGLYALDNAPSAIEALIECDELLEIIDGLKEKPRSAWLGLALVYVTVHEIGHWIFNEHSHHNAIGRSIEEIQAAIDNVRSLPIDERLREAAAGLPDLASAFDKEAASDLLAEEIFCDRFAAGAFFARAASDGSPWQDAFVSLRLIQEAMRLLHRTIWIAKDFQGDERFLSVSPTLKDNVVARGFSSMHARAYISSTYLSSYVPRIYKEYGEGPEPESGQVSELSDQLLNQSLVLFTQIAGPSVERCLFLMLRAVRAKRNDVDLYRFFEKLRQRFNVTHDGDARHAFEKIVLAASQHELGD